MEVRSACADAAFSPWVPAPFSTQVTGTFWDQSIAGATKIFTIRPSDFPVGTITGKQFVDRYPNLNQHKTFIADPRLERMTAPNGLDSIRLWDPVVRPGENQNPYFRRNSYYNNTDSGDNFAQGGLPGGADIASVQWGMYFHPHTYTGTTADRSMWSMGRHSKWMMGVSGDLGFGVTGGNIQPPNEFEVVFTHYSATIDANGKNAKGDFPYDGQNLFGTDFDRTGQYGPKFERTNPAYVRQFGHLGLGIYSPDPRHGYNYEEQIWATYPGTNVRRPYTVGVYYEFRVITMLNTPGLSDGIIHWEWRENGGPWQVVARVENWFVRPAGSTVKIRRVGPMGMFNGGWGNGWSWGVTSEYPDAYPINGGPAYDRGFFITYYDVWGK